MIKAVSTMFFIALVIFPPSAGGQQAPAETLDPARQPSFLSGFRLVGSEQGNSTNDQTFDVAVDARGYIYVAGSTRNDKLPTTANAYQRIYGGDPGCSRYGCLPGDGFLMKLDPSGQSVLALTYFGGAGWDVLARVLPAPGGDVVVIGRGNYHPATPDALFVQPGAAFIARFNADLSELKYFTSIPDGISAAEFDADGRLYISGWFSAGTVPRPERQGYGVPCAKGGCGFAARLSPSLTQIETMATLPVHIHRMRLAPGGGLWFMGWANETWTEMQPDRRAARFPKPWPSFPDYFIAKLSVDLDRLESAQAVLPESRTWYSDYYAPKVSDWQLDGNGNLYLTGRAHARLPVTANALQRSFGGAGGLMYEGDAFLIVVRPSSELQYSSWLGTARGEAGQRVVLDRHGIAWVLGRTDHFDDRLETPCVLWVAGIDPRRRGDDSLRYSACANIPFLGRWWGYDGVTTAGPDGLILAGAPQRAPVTDNLDPVPPYNRGHSQQVYRVASRPRSGAALDLSMKAPSPVRRSDTWVLETIVSNHGDSASANTRLDLRIPEAGYAMVSAEADRGWCALDLQMHCELGAVDPGARVSVRLTIRRTGAFPPYAADFATQVAWSDPDGRTLYNWATKQPPAAFAELGDLELTVEGYQPVVKQGTTLQYTFTVRNLGPDDASDVRLEINSPVALQMTPTLNCYWNWCSFRKLKAGETVRVNVAMAYPTKGRASLGALLFREEDRYPSSYYDVSLQSDPKPANNSVRLPIDVVGDEPPAPTVLESSRYLGEGQYGPRIDVFGKNIYATTTGYWDGQPRPTVLSHDYPSATNGTAYISLQAGDTRPGLHRVKVCSAAAGCSNELEVKLEADGSGPKSQQALPRMSLRLEKGILSPAPKSNPRPESPHRKKQLGDGGGSQ